MLAFFCKFLFVSRKTNISVSFPQRHCVSGSLDGKLIIWDTWTGNKVQVSNDNSNNLFVRSKNKIKMKISPGKCNWAWSWLVTDLLYLWYGLLRIWLLNCRISTDWSALNATLLSSDRIPLLSSDRIPWLSSRIPSLISVRNILKTTLLNCRIICWLNS